MSFADDICITCATTLQGLQRIMPELSEQNQEKRKRKSQWNTTNNMSATSRRIMLYWQMCIPMTELKRFVCDNNRAKERGNL